MSNNTAQELLGGNVEWSGNWTLGGCEFYGEIMDTSTFGVWLTTEPITPEQYADIQAPDGFRKSGCGRSQHDAAFFRRPPNADVDGPVETIRVGNYTFALVARPGVPETGFDGVMVLPVHKSHRLLFRAGRTLEIINTNDDFPGGTSLVPQVTESHLKKRRTESTPRAMPPGWTSHFITLTENLVIDLPSPARVAIFNNGDIFHGPTTIEI
jgi:hypothetical protein